MLLLLLLAPAEPVETPGDAAASQWWWAQMRAAAFRQQAPMRPLPPPAPPAPRRVRLGAQTAIIVVRARGTISIARPLAGAALVPGPRVAVVALCVRHPLEGGAMIAVSVTAPRADLIDLDREAEEERLLGLFDEVTL